MIQRKFGWKPQLPDHRDFKVTFDTAILPAKVDLRPNDSPIYDQGQLGSCTGNSIAAAYQFEDRKQKHNSFIPSRLFIYYNERKIEGTIKQDAGAQIRDGIKVVNKIGVCPEDQWPYIESKFKNKPSKNCFTVASKNQALQYDVVTQTHSQLRGCLAAGYPFVFGFTVYNSFMNESVAKTGVMNMPTSTDSPEGGHAVMCVGYDDERQVYIIRNSWGAGWGDKGYFYMPYQYMLNPNLCSDFWKITLVE